MQSILCFAAYCGSTPVVEALIHNGVGKVFCNENCNMPIETGLIMVTNTIDSIVTI